MQQFKIDNFKKTHPDTPLPNFCTLSTIEVTAITNIFRTRLCLPPTSHRGDICKALLQYGENVPGLNWAEACFDVTKLISDISERTIGSVLLSLDNLEIVDRFEFNDLIRYFADLIYPSSDDATVFDSTCEWAITFFHDGSIYVWRGEYSLSDFSEQKLNI